MLLLFSSSFCSASLKSDSFGLNLELLHRVDGHRVGGVEVDRPGGVIAGHKLVQREQFGECNLVLDEGESEPDAVPGALAKCQKFHYVPFSFSLLHI